MLESFSMSVPRAAKAAERTPAGIAALSVALHGLLMAALVFRLPVHVTATRLPGSDHGSHLVLTFVPGRATAAAGVPAQRTVARLAKPKLSLGARAASSPGHTAEAAPQPDSSQGNAGRGEGDITIALMQFIPDPKPDLSALPPGTRGDVILYAVIGADGRIEHLTLTRGLGYGVDQTVIATVEQWTFHPATRNGKPVPSEQEFHFHYEKS